jgi:hypothetical protein
MVALLLAVGCPAEWLRIPVPEAGLEALSMEDVRRDTERLAALSGTDRLAFVHERFDQMGLVPEGSCGERTGHGPEVVAIVASSDPSAIAAAISVAKALHGRPPDPRGALFCVEKEPAAARVVTIGAVAGGEAVWDYQAERVAVHAPAGAVDHRRTLDVATSLVPMVEGWLGGD